MYAAQKITDLTDRSGDLNKLLTVGNFETVMKMDHALTRNYTLNALDYGR